LTPVGACTPIEAINTGASNKTSVKHCNIEYQKLYHVKEMSYADEYSEEGKPKGHGNKDVGGCLSLAGGLFAGRCSSKMFYMIGARESHATPTHSQSIILLERCTVTIYFELFL